MMYPGDQETQTERNAATLREIDDYPLADWLDLMIDCLTREENEYFNKERLFRWIVQDNLLNADDWKWLKTQTGIEA